MTRPKYLPENIRKRPFFSDEWLAKMRKARIGRKPSLGMRHSPETRKKLSAFHKAFWTEHRDECLRKRIKHGQDHPLWKGGLIKKPCFTCSAPIEVTRARLRNRNFCSRTCSSLSQRTPLGACIDCDFQIHRKAKRCRPCYYKWNRGTHSPLWKGGISPEEKVIRASKEYQEWRAAVYRRDGYTCTECRKKGRRLQADHVKPFADFIELRFDVSNGRTLCIPCHKKSHMGNDERNLGKIGKNRNRKK